MKSLLSLAAIIFISMSLNAQSTQTVRGKISDKVSKETLIGATIQLLGGDGSIITASDANGNFRLSNVPLGRQTIKVSYLGYRETLTTIIITSGKESIMNIELEESVILGKEINIVAERRKDKPINEMTTVSARSFTIEETNRYAGSLNDPSRMAANYAGVSGANDSRNDIVIRGNSPLGVLWRLNGVEIPNPNHFGSLGSTGGPVSILNNNLLDNSDFITGAFPAEYGNALAGVFDLKMRSGNNEKYEFLGQVGFNGFELGAEGPISKKNGSSFLLNYRYSTLGVFKTLGINFGTGAAVPEYQDISFKVDVPTNKLGRFSIFGIAGKSYIEILDKDRDTTEVNLYGPDDRSDGYFGNTMAATGISHLHFFGKNSYGKLSLTFTHAGEEYKVDSVSPIDVSKIPSYRNNSYSNKIAANYFVNNKFSSRDNLKTGITFNRYNFQYTDSFLNDDLFFQTITNTKGDVNLIEAYSQWQHKFNDQLTLNSGIHYQYFAYNETQAVEPRIGLRWEIKEGTSLSLASGIHHQLQPLYTYFTKTLNDNGTYSLTNTDLDFTKSIHYVLAFDKALSKDMRLKTEIYYQDISNVPVEKRSSYFSMLNEGADFGVSNVDSLENKGKGKNYGIEITWEKFYSKGYYFLLTASVYESKYKGSDGVERNTAFNGNYVLNVLAGKEWKIKKENVLALNLKLTNAGGKRYTPVDLVASAASNSTEYKREQAFEKQFKAYFRTDVKVSYRINRKKVTHEMSLDVDNVFNTKNIFRQIYNPNSNSITTEYQIGLFPVPQYRITF